MATPVTTEVAWIGLGANIGHRGQALARLRDELVRRGLVIDAASSEIYTRAVGLPGQPDYHNQVIRVHSEGPLTPDEWLRLLKDAEAGAGRKPTYRWGPRRADADILLLGPKGDIGVDEPDLVVPHPRLHERPFLVRLLAELGMTAP
ncbi:MAG: 2-amino-4-hydroxy-6-hydroxymethyldihydropteridine diphosphokinase [Candidatus Dormibacteraeota bacterium]|nr:2-amino-4-hydroxy-6-hydroxymethyldihydropteridine diphosphokinase [Candidatus Dormibacteraeota bacterium]